MVVHGTASAFAFCSTINSLAGTHDAAHEAAACLREELPDGADLIIVLATMHHADDFASLDQILRNALGAQTIIGITGQGVIGSMREIESGPGLSVLAGRLPKGVRIKSTSTHRMDWVAASTQTLQAAIAPDSAPAAMFYFGDPFTVPTSRILLSLAAAFPQMPIIGGLASGGKKSGENRLMLNGRIYSGGAIGLSLGGDIRVDTTVSQGCRPVGKPLVITKSKRNVLLELAGKTALETMNQLIASMPEADRKLILSRGPDSLPDPRALLVGRVIDEYKGRFGRGDFIIRKIMGFDPKSGYVAISDPQAHAGQTIQFHIRDQQTAREDFQLLLDAQNLHGPAAAALLFSCNGRGTRLFSEPDADARLIHDSLGNVPLAGFFAAGEIGPVGGRNFLHGQTASLAVLRPA